jgi:CRISPR-associated protein Cas1
MTQLLFPRPPVESLAPASDRWTPLFFEHGRLEVDDSSVMWLGSDGVVLRVPVATVSALLLGPGSTVTHAAIKACAESNTPVCWVGADSLHFYATGTTPTHDNSNARLHAELYAAPHKRNAIARAMFARRFPDLDVASKSIQQLRGYEGERVRTLYADFGSRYAVSWKGRNYDPSNWSLADNINRAISTANAALYALCSSVVCSMGFLPQLGFIHSSGTLPFVFDIADIYKPETTLPAAFSAISVNPSAEEDAIIAVLKDKIEEAKLLLRIPKDIKDLMR